MPDLTNTVRWLEFVPDLLGNAESPRPFYLLLHGSMSKAQMKALDDALESRSAVPDLPEGATEEQRADFDEKVRAETVAKYAKALEPFIKMGEEPLSFEGTPVRTLHEYFDFVTRTLAGLELFLEPYHALMSLNSLGARTSFFSGRLSGGFSSTPSRRNGKARRQTAAR